MIEQPNQHPGKCRHCGVELGVGEGLMVSGEGHLRRHLWLFCHEHTDEARSQAQRFVTSPEALRLPALPHNPRLVFPDGSAAEHISGYWVATR